MSFLPHSRQIFISYAHQDAEMAARIAEYLGEQRFHCWVDQAQLRVGQLYDDRIADAIARSAALVVLVSRAAAASDYVKYETTAAVTRKIPIAPVFVEMVPKGELKAPLDFTEMRLHALNFSQGKLEENLPRLARELDELLRGRERKKATSAIAAALVILLVLATTAWVVHLQRQKRTVDEELTHTQRSLKATLPVIQVLADAHSAPPLPPGSASPTLVASAKPQLAFQISGLRAGGSELTPLDDHSVLASGDHYVIRAEPLTDGYLYVFQQDSTGKLEWLFPQNSTSSNSTGRNPVSAGSVVYLPSESDMAYTLDDTIGSEHFFAVLSLSRWKELEEALGDPANPTRNVPLANQASEALALRAKGIAGTVRIGARDREIRTVKGRSYPAVIQPLAHRSTAHWLFVHRVIQHTVAATP